MTLCIIPHPTKQKLILAEGSPLRKWGRRLVGTVTAKRAGFWRRHRALKWTLGVLLLVFVALGVAISVALHNAEPMLRAAIVDRLEEHFHARVELDSFHVSLVNGLWAEGKGLRIWPPAQGSGLATPEASALSQPGHLVRPIIQIADFRFHAPLRYNLGEPVKISMVELKGLDIDIPPKTHFTHKLALEHEEHHGTPLLRFEVESIRCDGAHLTLETDKPGKLPLEFDIAHIKLTGSTAGSMQFDAQLTNPKPAGLILTTGAMGPWKVDDPGETPLSGSYRFEHADLGVFKGIAGILESTGRYEGVLRDLVVDGQTDTPDFRLTSFGTAMPLHTVFHAHVDGTDGDTLLEPVNATLGQSHFTAEGKVVRVAPGTAGNGTATPGGHEIALNVKVDHGRMEDFLRLTSKSGTPLLTGTLALKATLEIPPGSAPVEERLKLKGSFTLDDAQFTSVKIQNDLGQLSMRGQGLPKEARHSQDADVRSAMQSDFTMADAKIALPNLKYTVPGAEIDLKGTYGMHGGLLTFTGTAKTDATVSEMVGGWKGALLKPADRYFQKDGAGTEVPIHVSGTRESPQFGVDLGRMKHTHPQLPGQP
ncbi:MAG: hypothetical protein ABR957_14555 [Terracidiphilus sp.]|jgi:hypothetical protein